MLCRDVSSVTASLIATPMGPHESLLTSTPQKATFVRLPPDVERMIVATHVMVKENNIMLRELKANLNVTKADTPIDLPFVLPVDTKHDLSQIDNYLSNTEKFRTFNKFFGFSGGMNQRKCVYNVLKRLMTNKLATNYNFDCKRGVGGKVAFGALTNIYKFIKFQVMSLHKNATDSNIKFAIGDWLKQAPARLKNNTHSCDQL